MHSTTSLYTGNTTYHTDDERFSSMSIRPVQVWESTMTGKPLTEKELNFWRAAGNVKTHPLNPAPVDDFIPRLGKRVIK